MTESAEIPVAPAALYAILADYRVGHPAILPRRNFAYLEVEEGGVGAGTRIRFEFRAPGVDRMVRAVITEPEPGRVLVEEDLETGSRTTFTVEQAGQHGASSVTIETAWDRPGLAGWIERLLAPGLLQRIYADQLRNLSVYAQLRHS